MNRFLSLAFSTCLLFLSAVYSLHAQTESNSRRAKQEKNKSADSVKNQLLIDQSEELKSIKKDQFDDSIRLIQLKIELQQLGNANNSKKQALAAESEQIRTKDSLRNTLQKLKIDSLRSRIIGFPVVLDMDTVLFVYSKLASLTPKERADAITNRLRKLAKNYYFKTDSLGISTNELTTDVFFKDEVILSITDLDAEWMNTSRKDLAEKYLARVTAAVHRYKINNSWQTILREVLMALAVLVLLILIIYSILKLFRWIKLKILKQRGKKLKGIKIRSYQILDTKRQISLLFTLINFTRWFIILLLIYWSLPVLFGIFPFTGGYAATLVSYFLDPIKKILFSVWDYLPNLFTVLVLIIFFRYFIRILIYFKSEIERGALKIPGFYVDWANPTFQIIRVLVLAFMVIVIFPYLPGSDSQIFKGVSVFLGVLVTFGSAGALGNVVSGLVLTYMRAYKIGDRVEIGETMGDVVEKSLLVTRIKTIKNEIVSIPNTTVMGSHTTNYSAEAKEEGLIIHTTVTIGYENLWPRIHELLMKAALLTELVEKIPSPFVFQTGLDDFYVSYQINVFTRDANKMHVTKSQLHENIQTIFNEAGVEIMSAHYKYIRDGNQTTVPPAHLPKDYVAPDFNVKLRGTGDSE